MAKTAEMRLIELMVLKQDITAVIECLGKKGCFQFQSGLNSGVSSKDSDNEAYKYLDADVEIFEAVHKLAVYFGIKLEDNSLSDVSAPNDEDRSEATKLIGIYNDISARIADEMAKNKQLQDAYKEALAFSNLKVSFSEMGNLTFLSLRIGKIDPASFERLQDALKGAAMVVPMGNDKSHVLIAAAKKSSVNLEEPLKLAGFVEIQLPEDFKGVPDDMLESLLSQKEASDKAMLELEEERKNFAETHNQVVQKLYKSFSMGKQIIDIQRNLESTGSVYRISGWVPMKECDVVIKDLEKVTEERIAVREFEPFEVADVISGKEQVPVKLSHGKFVKSFERMIFSYGSPVYGTTDPTPFVAVFFTILFGIMFGDLGQGLVFVLVGLLMSKNIIKVGGWNKFAPIFTAIGVTSSLMGLLTGEFFSNETLLEPFSEWVTGLFGTPHAPILKMIPSDDPSSIYPMLGVFGIAVAIGFVINTIGLILNIKNNISMKKYDKAFFGKEGLAGAVFFWYVIATILRVVLLKHSVSVVDWVIIGVSLFFAAFAEPFENLIMKKKPLLENGLGTYIISSVVEIIEVISGYLSNTVSFVRVGAFALSHAVLDFTIVILTGLVGGEGTIGGILILIVGNAIIIVLEGMIVAIQVIRLQYYEFFSKFFHETGREFKPFEFELNM
ncbi:MAG: ATPase [Treponema sp.]|nr:ATPase [Treponema sp.]